MAYAKEEIKAGILIVISLLILSLFTILVGGTHFFEKFDTYYVHVMNAAGLETGSQVRLGGVRVGRVLDISAPEKAGESVVVKIGLRQGTPVYKGTKAMISQIGFVGDIYLLLSVRESSDERHSPGDTIPVIEGTDFTLLMAKVDSISDSLDRLINDVDRVFSRDNVDEIEKTIRSMGHALDDVGDLVRGTRGDLSELLKTATVDFKKAEEAIETIKNTAGSIGVTADAITDTTHSITKSSESVGTAVDLQSQNLSALIASLRVATETLQDVLREIKHKPWSIMYREGDE